MALKALSKSPDKQRRPGEDKFVDGTPVPSMDDQPTKELSVIVPAYNEKDRRASP